MRMARVRVTAMVRARARVRVNDCSSLLSTLVHAFLISRVDYCECE